MSGLTIITPKKTVTGVTITRKTYIPKNKYSPAWIEHSKKMHAGEKPPQDFHSDKSEMVIESVEDGK